MLRFMKRHPLSCMLFAAVCAAMISTLPACQTRPPGNGIERNMVTTGYCKCKQCCGWKRTWYGKPVIASGPHKGERKHVGITASGTKAKRGVIAADTSRYPFGTVMYVPGYGYGKVEDRGSAIQGEHIDLCFKHHRRARQWGKEIRRVKIWIPAKR